MTQLRRDRSVFVNCPFDLSYKPLFDAIVFALVHCRFEVRSALEVNDAGDLRLAKIVRLIEECRLSVHDISRIELDADSGLPRFNMPIELGIALGAKHLGDRAVRDHLLLVMDSDRYRYQRFASDLFGVDIHAHSSTVPGVLQGVRDFLAPHADESLPGATAIGSALDRFEHALPELAAAARQHPAELTYVDRLRHLTVFVEGYR
ncbi:hypothetical protein [Sphingomonas sp.]|uniref:hypothetical protein n=1 Tax=Sphingomonas sp. TaxID=28214 RepID=UPI0035BC6E99